VPRVRRTFEAALPSCLAAVVVLASFDAARGGLPRSPLRTEERKLLPDDGESGDLFGHAIAIVERVAFVGAENDDDDAGAALAAFGCGRRARRRA